MPATVDLLQEDDPKPSQRRAASQVDVNRVHHDAAGNAVLRDAGDADGRVQAVQDRLADEHEYLCVE